MCVQSDIGRKKGESDISFIIFEFEENNKLTLFLT